MAHPVDQHFKDPLGASVVLCPKCQVQYPSETARCPKDGAVCLASFEEVLTRGPMSVSQVVKLALATLHALSAWHERGKVHGAIGPKAVFMAYEEGDIQVALATSTVPLPPSAYVPPQILKRKELAFDLYGVGILIHHGVTGRVPNPGEPLPPLAEDVLRYVPAELDELLVAVTRGFGKERPTIDSMRQALEALELDSTILEGHLLAPTVRSIPNRQIVLGPGASSVEAGHADTVIQLLVEPPSETAWPTSSSKKKATSTSKSSLVQVPRSENHDSDKTIISPLSFRRVSFALPRRYGFWTRWWLVGPVLTLGAVIGYVAVRWFMG